ncbi:MAG: permease, partial [bacterium]
MEWKSEWKPLALIVAIFLAAFYLPVGNLRFDNAIKEALYLVKWYAREHVLLCLIPALFIAGAISVFISQASVMKYLGARANKFLSYGVASVSGTILAVCSCTVLPLFAGIYKMGAGIGPASAFLYSGPAINVLAIILTARILGLEMGIARAVGAVLFSVIIGLIMHFLFRKEELEKASGQMSMPQDTRSRPLWQNAVYFGLLVGILVFANWGEGATGFYQLVYSVKWVITALFAIGLGMVLVIWFKMEWWKTALVGLPIAILAIIFRNEPMIPFGIAVIGLSLITSTSRGEARDWFDSTWGYAKMILPLLLFGVLIAGA